MMERKVWSPPEWMSGNVLEALGGRTHVVEVMSRDWLHGGFAAILEHKDMKQQIELLNRLHDEGLL